MIPYGRQTITEEDISAVVAVLRSDYLTQGPAVPLFEQSVAAKVGARHAIATNSATSALHIACLALNLGPGDHLWTSPNTFVASANCARYCGAGVDFVDIDPDTYNMSVDLLQEKLEHAEKTGKLPKVVVPVHFAGQPCDMPRVAQLAKKYGFSVIEDASHAIGARYGDAHVGSCLHSEVTIFSFHPVKIITTGEGGIATTNNSEIAERMSLLRSHGITRTPERMQQNCKTTGVATPAPWYYEQLELGHNYRMSDLQAALGISQLNRLSEYVQQRTRSAQKYDDLLCGLPIKLPARKEITISALHLYPIQLPNRHVREIAFHRLRSAGFGVNVHYIPVHTQPYYRRLGFSEGNFPQAEHYYERAISLPLFPGLKHRWQNEIREHLSEVLSSHGK